jgi:hypothetical protein
LNSSVLIFREDKNINQSESWQESVASSDTEARLR